MAIVQGLECDGLLIEVAVLFPQSRDGLGHSTVLLWTSASWAWSSATSRLRSWPYSSAVDGARFPWLSSYQTS